MKLQLRSTLLALAGALCGATAMADVNVLTAWYGQTCNTAHGNVTAHVKSRCDGRPVCQYVVDSAVLGDPAPGCQKNFVVLFSCRGQSAVRLAQLGAEAHGKPIVLSCTP